MIFIMLEIPIAKNFDKNKNIIEGNRVYLKSCLAQQKPVSNHFFDSQIYYQEYKLEKKIKISF